MDQQVGYNNGRAGAAPQPRSSLLKSVLSRNTAMAKADALGGSEVDYDTFIGQYWPRFNEKLRRELEPSMVFAGMYIRLGRVNVSV
jgi:hypothetical protein